ncbi:MAG: MFS transporter [Treponemataceae bacterium]
MKNHLQKIYRDGKVALPFLFSILFFGLAYGLYRGVQDNYYAEITHVDKFDRGLLEFFRELPGLCVIFILALLYKFSEIRIYRIGMAIALCGVAGFLFGSSDRLYVFIWTIIFSLGEHIIMPVKSTISVHLAKENCGGLALGILNSIRSIGNIVGFFLVTIVFYCISIFYPNLESIIPFKIIFAGASLMMFFSVLCILAIKETPSKIKRERLYFHKKFTKFYILEVFYGARKQVFLTFGPYVLILQYGADTKTISFLLAISAGFCIFFSPLLGKIIDKVGYKIIMVADTLVLIIVCLLYGFAHKLFPLTIAFYIVCINYILDTVISVASMATNMYAKDLSSSQEEFATTITTGISVNHLISILIALLGGLIWQKLGIELLFTLSAILGLVNSIFAATIKIEKPNSSQER